MPPVSDVRLLVTGYGTPEGPAFDAEGNLFFVDWDRSSIIKLTPEGHHAEYFNTGGIPAGLAFHRDGSLWVADEGKDIHGLLRITPDKKAEIVVNSYHGQPLNGANDLVFAKDGTLYFSDPWASSVENPVGGFYRLHPDGRLEQIDTGLAFPNGVALAADESAVYLAETGHMRIFRYPLNADGSIGPREHWGDTGEPLGPDGMCFDTDGYLYCAHFGGGRVDVFAPNGDRVGAIPVPGEKPTNCAFGGPENRTLVITEVATASLYQVEMRSPGLPLNDCR